MPANVAQPRRDDNRLYFKRRPGCAEERRSAPQMGPFSGQLPGWVHDGNSRFSAMSRFSPSSSPSTSPNAVASCVVRADAEILCR